MVHDRCAFISAIRLEAVDAFVTVGAARHAATERAPHLSACLAVAFIMYALYIGWKLRSSDVSLRAKLACFWSGMKHDVGSRWVICYIMAIDADSAFRGEETSKQLRRPPSTLSLGTICNALAIDRANS